MKAKIDVKSIVINAAATTGGAVASGLVDTYVFGSIGAGLDPKIKALIKIGVGAFAPALMSGKKSKGDSLISKVGDGMIAVSGYQLARAVLPSQIPAIAGVGAPYLAPISGAPGLHTVSGAPGLQTVSGMPEKAAASSGDDFLE